MRVIEGINGLVAVAAGAAADNDLAFDAFHFLDHDGFTSLGKVGVAHRLATIRIIKTIRRAG